MTHVTRFTAFALFALLVTATGAQAVITKLTPLAEVLESDQFIFIAKVDNLDPDNKDRPTATFKLDKKLKGEVPFERIPVNMTGDEEAKKAGDTKTFFERLDASRELVFFVRKQAKTYNAKVFVEGSWFSIYGKLDADDKTVRWAFLHGEPFLRRTFKGTSAEMVKTVEDALAKKAKPPEPDEKEKGGYGPAATAPAAPKKCDTENREQVSGIRNQRLRSPVLVLRPEGAGQRSPGQRPGLPCTMISRLKAWDTFALSHPFRVQTITTRTPGVARGYVVPPLQGEKQNPCPLTSDSCLLTPDPAPRPSGPLFAVIPSLALIGPMAIIAALFPGVFARMAVGMKRWRAFLVIASINSSLALIYWAVFINFFPQWTPSGWGLAPKSVTIYFTVIALVGFVWAGQRYRRMACDEPTVTGVPGRTELLTLVGLTAFAALSTALTAYFADWNSTVTVPLREFTFIGIALLTATTYAGYRALTHRVDTGTSEMEPPVRLSLSGESVGLGTLALCGIVTVLLMSGRGGAPLASGTDIGDAEANFAPRLVGEPVALDIGKNDETFGRVMSNLALDGDRLYFGVEVVSGQSGRVLGVNRHTGKLEWTYDEPGMKSVFCTPTIANGKVYCGEGMHTDKGCRLFCANAADGNAAWEKPFKTKEGHTEGTPAVANGKVYFPAGDDGLICADANTGSQLWQYTGKQKDDVHIDAPPVVVNGTVFVGSGLFNYVAVALDANTGTEKWRTDLKLRVFGPPLVSGTKVFYGVGTGNMGADTWKYDEESGDRDKEPAGAVCCLDTTTGKEEWRYPLPKSAHAGLAADAFSVYAGCRDGNVYAIDRKTGKLRWKAGVGSAMMSAPAVAATNGFPVAVYAVSREGRVFCLHPQTGEVMWWRGTLPGYDWAGREKNDIMCAPLVVTTPTATGSKRTIYIGALLTDPNENIRHIAVFKFEDVIGE